jgi:aconitate hydratase
VTEYLRGAGLLEPLEKLGFALAGYGCTTCIGNSGPLDAPVAEGDRGERPRRRGRAVGQSQLRGPDPPARAGELPRLAAAGRGVRAGRHGGHRPDDAAAGHRIGRRRSSCATSGRRPRRSGRPSVGRQRRAVPHAYASVFDGDGPLAALDIPAGDRYAGTDDSTYVALPPFFVGLRPEPEPPWPAIEGARVLASSATR